MSTTFNEVSLVALQNWVSETRQNAPLLDDEADNLLLHLLIQQHQLNSFHAAAQRPPTVMLYGHDREGKNQLLSALTGNSDRMMLSFGQKKLDYLAHVNPGHTEPAMAIRFTPHYEVPDEHYPLQLTLFSESELAQLFIRHYHASPDARAPDNEALRERLAQQPARGHLSTEQSLTREQAAGIIDFYRQSARRDQPQIDDETGWLFAERLPGLTLNERAHCLALFWGDDQKLARQWLRLASALHALGHVRQVRAPLDLLVDHYLLPVEGFLTPTDYATEETERAVIVCPYHAAKPVAPVSLPLNLLALLTAELVLPLPDNASIQQVEWIDLPVSASPDGENLLRTRPAFIADFCHQYHCPDIVLLCQAVARPQDVWPVAKMLCRWQAQDASKLFQVNTLAADPVNWQENEEENLQALLTSRQITPDTLEISDRYHTQQLLIWLTESLTGEQRRQRLAGAEAALRHALIPLFARYAEPFSGGEYTTLQMAGVVRTLQKQAARQGDLLSELLPSREALFQLCQRHRLTTSADPGVFSEEIDLFGETESADTRQSAGRESALAMALQRLWIGHLRRWACQNNSFSAQFLPFIQRIALCDTLITASYRLDLAGQLAQALHAGDTHAAPEASRVRMIISNFITWPACADRPAAQRPASRWNKGEAIFTPSAEESQDDRRLTRLPDSPYHAATAYVYDWLVGLLTLAQENQGYQPGQSITQEQWLSLKPLLPDS